MKPSTAVLLSAAAVLGFGRSAWAEDVPLTLAEALVPAPMPASAAGEPAAAH